MMPRFIHTQVRIILLAAIGLLLAPVLRAADPAPVPAKAADADKPAKAEKADKKAAKAKKDDVAPAKEKAEAAVSGLPAGVEEEMVKKAYPELYKMKEKTLILGADIRALNADGTSKGKKKAEKDVPKLEKRFKTMLDKLTKEYEKQLKPVDAEKETLVAQEAELSTKISDAESAGKKNEKLTTLKYELTKRLEANEQKATILRWLTTIPPIDDK
jgi:hypothetical protein